MYTYIAPIETTPVECGIGLHGAPLQGECSEWLALASSESLLDAAAAWAQSEHWVSLRVNPMDLAGALLEMGATCAYSRRTGGSVWVFWIDQAIHPLSDAPPNNRVHRSRAKQVS